LIDISRSSAVEIKTMMKDQFKDLVGPLAEHKLRTNFYLRIIAESGHNWASLIESSRILFVDTFYDPFNPRYKKTFRECLGIIMSQNSDATCEIHYRYHHDKPANKELEREAAHLFPGVIPKGMKVAIFCWREKVGGEDFHARYLLTNRGGIARRLFGRREASNH
jgi:hypothetical protein